MYGIGLNLTQCIRSRIINALNKSDVCSELRDVRSPGDGYAKEGVCQMVEPGHMSGVCGRREHGTCVLPQNDGSL